MPLDYLPEYLSLTHNIPIVVTFVDKFKKLRPLPTTKHTNGRK